MSRALNRETDSRAEFVERQMALQQELGAASIEAAVEALTRHLPTDLVPDIQALARKLSGEATTSDESDLTTALGADCRALGIRPLAAFRSLHALKERARQSVVAVLDGVSASLQYLVTLILVLAGISAIYQVFVYPQLADLYRSFGASEQPIVHTLFGRTPLVWLMIVVMLAAVWGVWWLFRKIGRSMSQGQALPGRWASWPLIGRVVSEQRSVLAQLWVLVMIDGGARLADAGERASERYGPWSVDSRLSGCEALGTIRAELLARVDAQNERLVAVFVRTRKIVVHVLRALVYILIAMVVTGMYGPIFSLGALT